MITGKTKSGFEYSIDDTKLNDMRYVDALAEADNGDTTAFSKVVLMTLGKEQRDKLYDHVAEKDGRVPVEKFSAEFYEIMEASAETKNS